ncbi:hypothetical protein ACLI1A_07700 [Flavobacterium sp. RHBU_3]|uniref:hypothetical protein n=1 Tax=Flavobacterium sp. RHBU_3 TaxID=3391184 RepID=UPI00398554EE
MFSKDVKKLCFDLLKEKFVPLGYKANRKGQEFIKPNDFGFDGMFFSTAEYAGLKRYDIKFFVEVRIEKIQQLINLTNEFVNDTQQFINPTCIVNIGTFTGNRTLNFETFSPEDVENAVETFWKIYNDYAIEFIKKCYDIDFLNSFYAKYANMSKDWFTAASWFIAAPTVAYLANKETFPEFRKKYMVYLTNDLNFPEDRLNEINEYLDKISEAD